MGEMMSNPHVDVWRFEFRTDMTVAQAPVIPLAYLVVVQCEDASRYLGLLSRTELSPAERQRVNLDTWPELGALKGYLPSSLDEAVKGPGDAIDALRMRHSIFSALQLVPVRTPVALTRSLVNLGKTEELDDKLEAVVRRLFEPKLAPTFPPALGSHRKSQSKKPVNSDTLWLLEGDDHHQQALENC